MVARMVGKYLIILSITIFLSVSRAQKPPAKARLHCLLSNKKRMRKRTENNSNGEFFVDEALISYFNIVKKTIQDYINELARRCRYRSIVSQVEDGTVYDDRSRLIDLYESCLVQDVRLQAVMETLYSQLTGERYMLATFEKGKWVRDDDESNKVQGIEFEKIIKGILDSKFFGYSLIEIMNEINPDTGLLKEVNIIERRNVYPDQRRVVKRQHEWDPGWNLDTEQYRHNYILINNDTFGLFSATTALILAKKYTLSNWVNFSHTYGQPIIHGKTAAEDRTSRQRLATSIASAAQNKVLVTGLEDEIDIKTFTMSNSEKIYDSLIRYANSEISNLILGSESMAGATQSYVGSTKAHEDIFRARIKTYRKFVENIMNEMVLPRLKYWGYIKKDGVFFKYSNQMDMSTEDKIKLFDMLTEKYEVDPDVIEKEWGVEVGEQRNLASFGGGDVVGDGWGSDDDHHIMSDEEYYRRYGHARNASAKVNFLEEV